MAPRCQVTPLSKKRLPVLSPARYLVLFAVPVPRAAGQDAARDVAGRVRMAGRCVGAGTAIESTPVVVVFSAGRSPSALSACSALSPLLGCWTIYFALSGCRGHVGRRGVAGAYAVPFHSST